MGFFGNHLFASIGLETKRFNPIIIEQVKKYNKDLNLDIKKVKIYLHIGIANLKNPKLRIKTKNPTLILDKNKIEFKILETEIDIFSYFKNNFYRKFIFYYKR